ncbi:hypothetical protein BS47DRAFT_65423 [Hydnum rufescens UP504]|uniref:Uncharacterized protein n=1 Tax=Hydnum rufescens UP504 TaxID=1448309 RepID=A0A9P6ARU2_9AGAM|nr:hypothetical protein BS47DRAFT_65423 [Hydnum rufescens UP504]
MLQRCSPLKLKSIGARLTFRAWMPPLGYCLGGDSEELIGKCSVDTGDRDKIFLAEKFGTTPEHTIRDDPEFVKSEFAKSLKKLRTIT